MVSSEVNNGVMEFIGTAILVFTIQVSVGLSAEMAAVAIGGILITIVYAGGPISGGHFNPSVSLAVKLRGGGDVSLPLYWTSQIVGAIAGALLGGFVVGTSSVVSIGDNYTMTQALLAEVIFTFILNLIVLCVATTKAKDNDYFGAAIGIVVMAGAITVGPISGGAFNPAVALGLAIADSLSVSLYVLGVVLSNLIGAVLAAGCFKLIYTDDGYSTVV